MKISFTLPGLILLVTMFLAPGCQPEPVLESGSVLLKFNKDLNGLESLIDKKTGRNYASELDSCIYILRFGQHYKDSFMLNSAMASSRKVTQTKDGLELQYRHTGNIPVNVSCKIRFDADSSLNWSIRIMNDSKLPLCLIEYPLISCTQALGNDYTDDRVVYPGCEGALLTGMNEKGASRKATYPGQLGAQMMYYYDQEGGFYYAAHDGQGYSKTLSVANSNGSIVLSQEYFLPVSLEKHVEMPYSVITDFSEGRWEAGALIYRNWANNQEWCKKTILQRDIPEWLRKPNLFVLFSFKANYLNTPAKANSVIKKYRDYFNIPLVVTGWSWEKNGIWIGPDYFPPVNGDAYYSELASMAKKRGDHMHVYNSGFRWAVKKPMTEKKDETRFTDFDGMDLYLEKGKSLTVLDHKGELLMEKRPWAHNYFICPGYEPSRKLWDSLFIRVYNWGFAGIDLDQNIGGHVDVCFSKDHGHPAGAGIWQHQAMKKFLDDARSGAKKISSENFLGIEEPCEIYIPQTDIHNARNFTLTDWPVSGPGGISIPLYNFIYHKYQLSYSGWIPGRSPLGEPKNAVGRAFLFGFMPALRGISELNINDVTRMMKGYVELFRKYPEFLQLGEMIGELEISGSETKDIINSKGEEYNAKWQTAQGVAWLSESGKEIAYAVANHNDKEQEIRIRLVNRSTSPFNFTGYIFDEELKQNIVTPENGFITLKMAPWQLCVLSQKTH